MEFPADFAYALHSYDGAFMGTTIARSSFKAYFGLDTLSSAEYANVSSNVTSCFQAAAFFGAAFSWALMESYGRRLTLQISTVIFIVGAILQTCPPKNLSYIYAGRSLCGLAVGGITGTGGFRVRVTTRLRADKHRLSSCLH